MKNNKYFLNTLLVAVLFLVMAVFMVLRAVQPPVILLPLNIPNMVLISVIVLLAEFHLAPGNDRCYICIPVLAALTFGILPLVAGFACQHTFWKIGLVGGVVFSSAFISSNIVTSTCNGTYIIVATGFEGRGVTVQEHTSRLEGCLCEG